VSDSHRFDFNALNAGHTSPSPAIEWVHGKAPQLILNLPDYAARNLSKLSHSDGFASATPSTATLTWAEDYAAGKSLDATQLAKAMTVAQDYAWATMPKALSFFTHQTFWSTVALVLMGLALLVFNRRKPTQHVPANRFQNMMEATVLYIRDEVVKPNISHHPEAWTPFFASLFIAILTCNLFGLVPIFGTATGSLPVAIGFALPIFALMITLGMAHNGGGFWLKLVPVKFGWNPMDFFVFFLLLALEWASLLIKPAVLALRLFANMLAGHTLLLVFVCLGFIVYESDPTAIGMSIGMGLVGWVVSIAFYMLELLVALVQAYVFTMLAAVFIGSCIHPEH
jgi:F-type H+-transporting ATPase subunit a